MELDTILEVMTRNMPENSGVGTRMSSSSTTSHCLVMESRNKEHQLLLATHGKVKMSKLIPSGKRFKSRGMCCKSQRIHFPSK
jgi:hypothetical protein